MPKKGQVVRMEKSKNKRANNMLWYVIGLCILLITITSVFMSANRKEEGRKPVESVSETVSDTAKESVKEDTHTVKDKKDEEVKKPEQAQSEEKKPETPVKPTTAEKQVFELPVNGYISKEYSIDIPVYSLTMNDYRAHTGIDILCEEGSAVAAAEAGTVKQVYDDPMMGTTVVIEHKDGIVTRYMNLGENLPENITAGASVKRGELIGAVGSSALLEVAGEPHLHFEVTVAGAYVDPLSVVDAATVNVMSDSVVE